MSFLDYIDNLDVEKALRLAGEANSGNMIDYRDGLDAEKAVRLSNEHQPQTWEEWISMDK
jgi:hypothetical protein